ncbi:DUF2599 domain-containing protein [Gordonia terrae]|uniref:DUF2599 domain-containing protein n=1 Tax=Gordonia terrae TaxID=2055 RepID=A0A2I1R8K1_9ACTN|nr:DUF2599 domain-containing protein [Gordonia terrae]PKZ65473.1 DUF2599 domain-containing protein [Gordonia terrae]
MSTGFHRAGTGVAGAAPRSWRAAAGALAVVAVLSACGTDAAESGPQGTSTAGKSTTSPSPTPYSSGPYSPTESAPAIVYRPPYIERTEWTDTAVGPSLSVFPTNSGRYTTEAGAMTAAWAEVVALDPTADTPGMQAQFDCHWRFARLVEPEKPSWNLEPGRPVVAEEDMVGAGCNPGFAEE